MILTELLDLALDMLVVDALLPVSNDAGAHVRYAQNSKNGELLIVGVMGADHGSGFISGNGALGQHVPNVVEQGGTV